MAYELGKVIFLSGLCDRERVKLIGIISKKFLSGLCDREHGQQESQPLVKFLSGLCDREQ